MSANHTRCAATQEESLCSQGPEWVSVRLCGRRRYEAGKKEGKFTEEEAKREHAKHSLERYMHYYQRWNENDKSRVKVHLAPSHSIACQPAVLSCSTASVGRFWNFVT